MRSCLGAEYLRNFREDQRAARCRHAIRHVAYERIGGDAGEPVGAAALQADRRARKEGRVRAGSRLAIATSSSSAARPLLGFVAGALRGEGAKA